MDMLSYTNSAEFTVGQRIVGDRAVDRSVERTNKHVFKLLRCDPKERQKKQQQKNLKVDLCACREKKIYNNKKKVVSTLQIVSESARGAAVSVGSAPRKPLQTS
jgi:hypothetical protein